MIFAVYFVRRFLLYFVGISLFFSLLFNLIEFFEKLVRVSSVYCADVVYFVFLHFAPSCIEFLPLASWLSIILMIREYHQRQEWQTLSLLMISKKKLISLLLMAGIGSALSSCVVNEWLVVPIAHKAEDFRRETFKQVKSGKITNKILWLPGNVFCSIGLFDVQAREGSDLTIIFLSASYGLEKVYKADRFKLSDESDQLCLIKGFLFLPDLNNRYELNDNIVTIPHFSVNMYKDQEVLRLSTMIKNVSFFSDTLSKEAFSDILQQLLKRLLFYLQIILYPALTFFIFCMAESFGHWKWLMLLVPYGCGVIIEFLVLYLVRTLYSN